MRRARRCAAVIIAGVVLATTGCGLAFGSSGEAERAAAALNETSPASGIAPSLPSLSPAVPAPVEPFGVMPSPTAPPTAPPTTTLLSTTSIPSEPPTAVSKMSVDDLVRCWTAQGVIERANDTFADGVLPTRTEMLTLIEELGSAIPAIADVDESADRAGLRAAAVQAATALSVRRPDPELAATLALAAPQIGAYLLETVAACFDGIGLSFGRAFEAPGPETFASILDNRGGV